MPDADFTTRLSFWQIRPDFDAQSRNGSVCSLTGLDRQKARLGRKPEEEDHFVLRGPMIDHEGYFDVRPAAILQTAKELGMYYENEVSEIVDEAVKKATALARVEAADEIATLQSKIELLTSLLRDDQYEVPYSPEDLADLEAR